MQPTVELLNKALAIDTAVAWAERIGVHKNAFTNAKSAGHVTPVVAGLWPWP